MNDLKHSQKDNISKLIGVIANCKDTKPSPVTWETMTNAMNNLSINNKEIVNNIYQYLKFGKLLLLSNEVVLLILSLSISYILQAV